VGLAALAIAALYLREQKEPSLGRLDLPGFVLSAAGLASVVYALAQVGAHGFGNRDVILFGLAGLALLTAFVAVELRSLRPMIDIRLFRNRLFAAANVVQFVSQGGLAGVFFLLPVMLQAERGMSPLESGLTTFPMAIGIAMITPIAGRVYMRIGPRRMIMGGLLVIVLSTLALTLVDLHTDSWWIRLPMLTRRWGFAFTLIPQQTVTFATIRPQDTGRASAAFNSVQRIGASFGVALLATTLSSRLAHFGATLGDPATRDGAIFAFHDAFVAGSLLCVAGIVASVLIDDRLAAPTMRPVEPLIPAVAD